MNRRPNGAEALSSSMNGCSSTGSCSSSNGSSSSLVCGDSSRLHSASAAATATATTGEMWDQEAEDTESLAAKELKIRMSSLKSTLPLTALWLVAQLAYDASLTALTLTSNSLIQSTSVFLSYFLAVVFLKQSPQKAVCVWLVVLAGGVALISSHVPTPPEPAAPALPAADAAVHVTAGAPTQIHTLAALDGAVAAPLPAGATAATAPAAANPAEPASAATDQLQQHTALLPAGGGSPAAPAAVAALSRHKNSHNTGGPSAPGGEAAAEATATAVAGVNTAANAAQWKPSRAAAAITAAPATAAAATAAHEDMKGSGSVPATAAATGTTDVAEDVGTREAAATAARGGHRESEAADSLVGYLLALLAAAAYALHTTALKAQETLGGNFDVDLIYGLMGLWVLLMLPLLTLLLHVLQVEAFMWPDALSWIVLLLCGLVGTAFADICWGRAVFLLNPVVATAASNVQIPISMLLDAFIFGRSFNCWYFVGTMAVVAAVLAVTLITADKRPQHNKTSPAPYSAVSDFRSSGPLQV
ncbi:hypothetical protein, conserved [Eimeria maxima]|uniref:Uncharacterized protein n=1 Tax=Eimeria maxima TaxID=5804 RepID=U6ME93_EIMMA|nr:hypothetical protein, conserved [Eimeria maxima]CDJ61383.1 hypothetical protein, conserved [Eimeria maxima]